MPYRHLIVAGLLVVLTTPAWAGKVIIDTRGVNLNQYQQDLEECQLIAKQVSVGRKAGAGAVAGAVVGAVFGAAVGNSDTVGRAAGAGGVLGGARGAGRGVAEKNQVVKNCLRNRGYAVLN